MGIFLVWTIIAYGVTSIIVWGSIFESLREWIKQKSNFFGDLVSCVLCTSTWVGFFMSIVIGSITSTIFDTSFFLNIFFDGMYTAGSVWALNALVEYYEENRPKQ